MNDLRQILEDFRALALRQVVQADTIIQLLENPPRPVAVAEAPQAATEDSIGDVEAVASDDVQIEEPGHGVTAPSDLWVLGQLLEQLSTIDDRKKFIDLFQFKVERTIAQRIAKQDRRFRVEGQHNQYCRRILH